MHFIPCFNTHFACQASGPLEQRPQREMFYSCPSVSAEAFFRAVSNQLASLDGEGSPYASSPEIQLKQTHEVAQAVQASLCKLFSQASNTLHFWSSCSSSRMLMAICGATVSESKRLCGFWHQLGTPCACFVSVFLKAGFPVSRKAACTPVSIRQAVVAAATNGKSDTTGSKSDHVHVCRSIPVSLVKHLKPCFAARRCLCNKEVSRCSMPGSGGLD